MAANGEDVDHIEAAYEALAAKKTITAELENSTTTLPQHGHQRGQS
jgi:hypothetical protein